MTTATHRIEEKTTEPKVTGLVHIYTGDGKGKTTAAIGLAVRALGSGLSVCYCSFHKDPEKYGYSEMEGLKKLGAHVINFAKYHPHMEENVSEATIAEIREEVEEAIETIVTLMNTVQFDLLILDEVLISIRDNYMDENTLIEFIKNKPKATELVVTGRGATNEIKAHAHYITNMEVIKHPYYENMPSRKGIEY